MKDIIVFLMIVVPGVVCTAWFAYVTRNYKVMGDPVSLPPSAHHRD